MEAVETMECGICGDVVPVSPNKKIALKKLIEMVQDTFGPKTVPVIRCENCQRIMAQGPHQASELLSTYE